MNEGVFPMKNLNSPTSNHENLRPLSKGLWKATMIPEFPEGNVVPLRFEETWGWRCRRNSQTKEEIIWNYNDISKHQLLASSWQFPLNKLATFVASILWRKKSCFFNFHYPRIRIFHSNSRFFSVRTRLHVLIIAWKIYWFLIKGLGLKSFQLCYWRVMCCMVIVYLKEILCFFCVWSFILLHVLTVDANIYIYIITVFRYIYIY